MMAEWRETTLDQLGRIITGKTPPVGHPEYFGGDIPFVTPTDMDGRCILHRTSRNLTKEGTKAVSIARIPARAVMVSCTGSNVGKTALTGRDCITNQQINSIIVESGDDPLFVYYNLSSRKEEIHAAAGGSAQPILNKSDFGRLSIDLPSHEEQRAIAHILGTLDAKIELNQRVNDTLEAMAAAIFKSWFVDFNPVRSKTEGRDTGLTREVADLFPDRFENSELGKIPAGWEVGTFDRFSEVSIGGDWGKSEPFEGAMKVICLRGVDIEQLRKTGYADPPLRWVKEKSVDQRRLEERDVLVASSAYGSIGCSLWAAPVIETSSHPPVVYSNFCRRLRCTSTATAIYLDRWLLLMRESGEIWEYIHGTAVPNLDTKALLSDKRVVCPPDPVLEYFCDFMRSIFGRIFSGESKTLAALRDALLSKLISGELRIKDVERFLSKRGSLSKIV